MLTNTDLNWLHDVAKRVKKHGADHAEVVLSSGTLHGVSVRLGKLEDVERSASKAYGIRAIVGKRQAFISSSDFSSQGVAEATAKAAAMAKLVPQDEFLTLPATCAKGYPELEAYDSTVLAQEQMLERALKIEEIARQNPKVTNSEGAGVSYQKSYTALLLASGFSAIIQGSNFNQSCAVVAGEGDHMQVGGESQNTIFFSDLNEAQTIGHEAANEAARKLNPRKIPSTSMPVVFDNKLSSSILRYFLAAINGSSVARGTSLLAGKLEETIMAKDISIYDDPLLPRGLGSQAFDAEGLLCEKLTLVENGKLNHYLLDLYSANKLGLTTNARASRGISSAPNPAPTNCYIAPGSKSREELLKSVNKGLYVTEVFGRGVNLINGQFSVGAVGFMIENGKLTYPVNEITIAGNLIDMWKELQIADDLVFRYTVNSPTMLVGNMMVAGT